MNGIFEHVVHEVWVWFDEVIKSRQDLQVFPLLLVEQVEPHFVLVKLHLGDRSFQLIPLVFNHLLSFLNFLFLLLQLFDFLINLFLHHLEKILMLDLELVHNPPEALLQLVDFFVELLANFHLKFVVQLFVD